MTATFASARIRLPVRRTPLVAVTPGDLSGAYLTARLRAARFDRALAVGVPAPAGSALAVHATRLTSVAERHAVARALRRAVRDEKDTRATRSARVPMHRANIAAARR